MTDTTWELPDGADQEPPPAAPQSAPLPEPAIAAEPAALLAARPPKRERAAADLLRALGAGFLALGGLALAGFLLPHTSKEPVYDLWDIDALFGPQALGVLAAAALLLPRRTRALASGLVLGAVPLWFAEEIDAFRPSTLLAADIRASGIFFLVAAGMFLTGFLLVLAATLNERTAKRTGTGAAPAPARRPTRAARSARLIVLLAGIASLAAFVTGRFMDWERTTVSLSGQPGVAPEHSSCCAIADVTTWTKADYIAGAVVLLCVIVAATVVRPRVRGAGLLFGAVFFLATGLAQSLLTILSPLRSNVGLAQLAAADHLVVTVSPLAGYWVAVVGVLLLAGTAVLLLTLNPARVRYPESGPAPVIEA